MLALIRKEILEAVRAGWANIPAIAALTVLLLITPMSRRHLPPDAVALLQTRLPIFLPLLAMPFYASTVLNRAIQTERLRGGLVPLLLHGGSARVWLAKVLAAFALAYVVMLLSFAGYLGYGAWTGRNVVPPASALPYLFVAVPLAALALIALQALLFWIMPRSTLLSVFLPLIVMFGGAQLVVLLGLRPLSVATGAAAVLASCAVTAASAIVAARFPRERAAGLVAH